jgi:hypothetical protein
MMVLRHILAVLCQIFSITPIVTYRYIKEDPLHSLHALWEHIKTLVCTVPVNNEEALHRRIVDACQTIITSPGIFERMRRPVLRRVEACAESHEEKFEHLF